MGNCYSAGSEDIETNLTNKTLRSQKANAGFQEGIIDVGTPEAAADQTPDIEALDRQQLADVAERLRAFLAGLQLSHPSFYSQTVADIVITNGGPLPYENLVRPENLSLHSLSYQSAVVLEDGSLFEGQWSDSSNGPEGLGVRVSTDGTLLEGFFLAGKAHGQGRKINNADKEIYTGEFANDLREGTGVAVTEDQTTYKGLWVADQRHGHGTETWTDGAVYDGQYLEGKKVGSGYFKWADGSTYQGQFADNMIQGTGEYKWADGRIYQGEWLMNKMHGRGVFIWEDGRRYEGDYQDDKKHGQGKFTWPDGRIYDGAWSDGRQHGVGVYTAADGKVRQGEWSDGKRIKWLDGGADSRFTTTMNNQSVN